MRLGGALLIALALVACTQQKRLAFNRIVIDSRYGGDVSYASAVDDLTAKANKICDQGYRKTNDYDTAKGSDQLLVWEIACRGVVRSDEVIKARDAPSTRGPF